MRNGTLSGTLAVVMTALVSGSATGWAAEGENQGRTVYLRYCGACHGPQGHGDGIAGTFMTPKPVDLTRIATKHDGKFPFQGTMHVIDGTDNVRAHGDPDMPVWGEVWKTQAGSAAAGRAEVKGKLMLITEYLQSIQNPPVKK
jgi:mono/diheme cytochrome c family protein